MIDLKHDSDGEAIRRAVSHGSELSQLGEAGLRWALTGRAGELQEMPADQASFSIDSEPFSFYDEVVDESSEAKENAMTTTEKVKAAAKPAKKRVVANPKKGQSFEQAMAETHQQYAGTFAKLAK